jgi:hypothetical protein
MKDKGHFIISIVKSCVRIGFGFWALVLINNIIEPLSIFIVGILIAECLGITEEIVDRR